MTLTDQLACARRELAMRRNVYPKWVATGRMKQQAAEHELQAMQAIVETLEKLQTLAEVSEEMKKCTR